MAQQSPSFNMNRLTSADRILLIAGGLFFIDTFLPWFRLCASDLTGLNLGINVCGSTSAWGYPAGFLGVLAALFALAMVAWILVNAMGMSLNMGIPASTLSTILVAGTFGFGILKFIFSITKNPALGTWIGLVLLLAIGYGGYMKMQEPKTTAAAPPSMPTQTPPPMPPPASPPAGPTETPTA
jgi:hypothetical protein